jgi:hypothetical protein
MQTSPAIPSHAERRAAMHMARRYLQAFDRTAFAAKHRLTPDCLAMRYARVLPDLMERFDLEDSFAEADAMVFSPPDPHD